MKKVPLLTFIISFFLDIIPKGSQRNILSPLSIDKGRRRTSHTPSMQTFTSVLEQGVPSLTLLDMAKKKSKSSAMQYSLQMSSAAQRTRKHAFCKETCRLE